MFKKVPLSGSVVLISVATSWVTSCDSSLRWQDYASPAGRFSVSMPGKPEERTSKVPVLGGKELNLQIVVTEFPNTAAYWVSYLDYPADLLGEVDAQQLLSQTLDNALVSIIQGEKVQEEAVTIGNVPCQKFQAIGTWKKRDASAKGIFCLKNGRLYQVLAMGKTEDDFSLNADKFIKSFQINS